MKRGALVVLLCSTGLPAQLESPPVAHGEAARWSQWRGPGRSGHCPGPAWPDRLTADSFRLQWRIPLGPSYSGPVVDRDRVYTTETVDEEREVARALDRRTGEERWSRSWEGAMRVPFFAARNGSWIRSTPAIDDGALFVAGMRDVLVCLDAGTGEERWRVDFVDRFGGGLPPFGFVSSPLVRDDAVYVQAGNALVKLDKRTGATVWRTLQESGGMLGGAFSSPVLATLRGVEQLVVQTRSRLCGVGPDDGEVLWSVRVRTFRGMNILTPLPFGDAVFTSAYGGRAHAFELTGDAGSLQVAERWTNRAQGYMTSPVLIEGHAYLYLRSKRFACVDLATGEVAWISDRIGDEYWSLVAQDDRILALTDGGELYLIRADPAGFDVVDRLEVADGATWAHLAVDAGQVFVRELDALAAYSWR